MDFLELVKQRYSARNYLPLIVSLGGLLWCKVPMPGRQCSSAMPAIGLPKPLYTLLYTLNIRRLGCVATTKRTTQILMQPSPLNIFVWLQPNKSWVVVGFVTLM